MKHQNGTRFSNDICKLKGKNVMVTIRVISSLKGENVRLIFSLSNDIYALKGENVRVTIRIMSSLLR